MTEHELIANYYVAMRDWRQCQDALFGATRAMDSSAGYYCRWANFSFVAGNLTPGDTLCWKLSETWPTPAELAALVEQYRESCLRLKACWDEMPEEMQRLMRPLPFDVKEDAK